MRPPEQVALAREYLLCGHLIDRASMPYLIARFGREEMRDIAIDEWMGASPVYTRRMQRVLGFEGDDVTTIFKGMQFDIGAPHEFLDFRYTVYDAHHGEFHLDHCGALMDVEPMGEEFVVTMCHDIEDPTFDATAVATNARARMRPIHRPPREPADRTPHCAWAVTIEPDAAPIPEPSITGAVRELAVAGTPLAHIEHHDAEEPSATSGLLADYSGPLVDPIDTACFDEATLSAICDEVCLQHHLLAGAFMAAVGRRHGSDIARELGVHQLVGAAGVAAARLVRLVPPGEPLGRIAQLVALHPLLRPRAYVGATVELLHDRVEVSLHDCLATSAPGELSWVNLLLESTAVPATTVGGTPGERALEALAAAADPRARCRRVDSPSGDPTAVARWELHLADDDAPQAEEVRLASMSTGAGFDFQRTTPVALTHRGPAR